MATLLGCHCRCLPTRLNSICLVKKIGQVPLNTAKLSQLSQTVNILKRSHRLIPKDDSNISFKSLHTLRNTFSRSIQRHGGQILLKPIRESNKLICIRLISNDNTDEPNKKLDSLLYILSVFVLSVGLAYAGVPFFKIFCRQFGFGGDPKLSQGHDRSKVGTMDVIDDREITVHFTADTHSSMRWNFKPQQPYMKVKPGETALAFYSAKNPTDKPITGISTYTVNPYIAAPYFNKIQCFCFEEQILNPGEQVDMPVFFYIDPEYDDDPFLEFEDNITLSYTFFEAKEGFSLPLPGFLEVDKPKADKQPT
ncbi:Cytochrome c oxidase assembly protein cox11 [Mactra antiquata]